MDNTTPAPLQGAQFEDTTITLAGVNTTYAGKKLGDTGLGYWISDGKPAFYAPTHILSGYKVSAEIFYSEEVCQHYIEELAKLMNWNRPLEMLVKDSAYQPEQINALAKKFWIEDAAETAGGGRW
jgi:hypothetical protein